ncbi:MAG: hypothetical protein LBU97_04625, partial [Alistipes sp.]|nr:hypothetical protein [Alistipes sp.]
MKFFWSNLRLLANQFRAVTLLNLVGLSVAFAVAVVVAIQTRYDLTYDRGHQRSGDIFVMEITSIDDPGGDGWAINQELPDIIKDNVPEIEAYCLLDWAGEETFRAEGPGDDDPGHMLIVQDVSTGFLDVFTPTIVAGDATAALSTPGHGMISRKTAERVFGTEDPIGQTLKSAYSTVTISAVYEDFSENSSVFNGVLAYMAPTTPNNYNYAGRLLFDPADLDTVVEKMNSIEVLKEEGSRYSNQKYHLTELSNYYLHGSMRSKGRFESMLYMVVMGVLIMVIAFINFVNLFMSMAPARVRKINTFRILGSTRGSLRALLALEGVVILFVSVAAGTLFVEWFSTSALTEFFTADISPEANIPVLVMLGLGLMAAAFAMALYPARYATSFDVAIALKGSMVLAPRGVRLRDALIVLQFAVAIFFICFSAFIRMQYDYMSSYSLGYQKENIVIVPNLRDSLSRVSFVEELRRNPDVVDVSWSGRPGGLGTSWGRDFEGQRVQVSLWPTDINTLDFFGVEVVAGEDFSTEMTGKDQVIVNQKFLDTYGFTAEQVIGKEFGTYRTGVIVGVAADVNFQSLYNEIVPMVFVPMPYDWATQGLVKIGGGDTPGTIAHIEETWNRFKPEGLDFSLDFFDEQLDAQYRTELNMSRLMGILGLVAVVTAVMGVYVIILFNSRYKVREIAIRKVNG